MVVAEPPPPPPPAPVSSRGPQPTILCPVDSINIFPGTSIQSVIAAYPGPTTFCLAAGVHSITKGITPKTGNTFVGEYGAIVDGAGWPMPPDENYGAFMAHNQDIDDVTIRNLVIRRMPKRAVHFFFTGADRWTVEYCEITANKTGIVIGNAALVRHNYIHHNFGTNPTQADTTGGGGYESYNTDGGLFEDNEISYNGANQKFVWSRGLVFRGNVVHHNYGNGIWYDGENVNALIENNIVEDHPGEGIFYEVSSVGIIRNNAIRRNGLSGVFISTSHDVDVYSNTLEDNFRGIQFNVDGARVGLGGEAGVIFDLQNNTVHHNTVRVGTRSGSLANTFFYQRMDSAQLQPYLDGTKNNTFTNNQYSVPNLTESWWDWADVVKPWSQWQAEGRDVTGTVVRTP
jgi:nitrous oxidase accessory protein NosD